MTENRAYTMWAGVGAGASTIGVFLGTRDRAEARAAELTRQRQAMFDRAAAGESRDGDLRLGSDDIRVTVMGVDLVEDTPSPPPIAEPIPDPAPESTPSVGLLSWQSYPGQGGYWADARGGAPWFNDMTHY